MTVRLFDKAAAPTPGTDSPVFFKTLPAAPALGQGTHFDLSWGDVGKYFNNGIGFDMTANMALLDNTAMGTAAVAQCSVSYK